MRHSSSGLRLLIPVILSTAPAFAQATSPAAPQTPPPPVSQTTATPATVPVTTPPAPVAPPPTVAPVPPPPSAAAAPVAPASPALPLAAVPAEPPPEPSSGVHTHDGLYFRLASGFGAYSEGFQSASSSVYSGKVEGTNTGFATVSEIALGGTIAKGLVLGGGIYSVELLANSLSTKDDRAVPKELDWNRRSVTLIGPFLDWYFDPHRGLHAQASLGFAQIHGIEVTSGSFDNHGYHADGGGLMLGVGYEWWVGDQWSLGVLARMTATVAVGHDDSNVDWYHGVFTLPSALFSATYH